MLSFTMRPMAEEAQMQELIRQAKDYLEEGNFAGAMRNLSFAVKAAPNRPDIRQALAEAYLFNGQPRQAMQELKKAVEIAPKDFEINESYGEALEDLESPQAALAFYGEMIIKFPNQLEPRARAASIHEELGQPKLAVKLWQEAANTASGIENDMVWVRWGQLLSQSGDNPGALKVFAMGLKQVPGSALLYFNQGALLSTMNKPKEAAASLQEASKLDGQLAEVLSRVGESVGKPLAPIHVISLRENADGLFYVPATLNEALIARMVVDANVKTTLVSNTMAHRLSIDTAKFESVNYRVAAKPTYKPAFKLKSVRVATATAKDVPAGVYQPSAEEHNAPRDGTLGKSFLDRYKYAIDNKHQQLVFASP